MIGDEPTDTREDSDSPEEALPQGEGGGGKPDAVGLEVKSVRKPCVGNPYARFDERGWETERWYRLRHRHWRKPPVTATPCVLMSPRPSSTLLLERKRQNRDDPASFFANLT